MKTIFASLALFGATALAATPAEYFVRYEGSSARWHQIEGRHGLETLWTSGLVPGLRRVRATDVSRLTQEDGVRYVEQNSVRHGNARALRAPQNFSLRNLLSAFGNEFVAPNDPYFARQWALSGQNGIHPEGAWAITLGSPDVLLASIDTGVESSHPDLSGRVDVGYDVIDEHENAADTHGHGSHVSGIMAGDSDNGVGIAGIAELSRVLAIRTVPNESDETDADVIEAFEYAVSKGARVANCSFGKSESDQSVGDVIKAAGERGLFVAVAAGNDGEDLNSSEAFPAKFQTPNMVVVAATNIDGEMTFFSNYGLGHVHVAAPGDNIYSSITEGGYAAWSGTSMAAPQVAGIAGLMIAANPQITPEQIKTILMETVDKTKELASAVDSGGIVNASRAVEAARALVR